MVVAIEDYRRLSGTSPDFKSLLRSGPDLDALELRRAGEPARVVDLGAQRAGE